MNDYEIKFPDPRGLWLTRISDIRESYEVNNSFLNLCEFVNIVTIGQEGFVEEGADGRLQIHHADWGCSHMDCHQCMLSHTNREHFTQYLKDIGLEEYIV